MHAPDIAVIGSGPAGLMAAETAASAGLTVTVFEAMPSVGRKFLMAGRGGLNLTHSEEIDGFLDRYGEARESLAPAIEAFSPRDLRAWADGLRQKTFVGSSGRVFPEAMKASPLLRRWLARLAGLGVAMRMRHRWLGWSEDGALAFSTPDGALHVRPAATILALGGASWPRLGSDGAWQAILARQDIAIAPLRPVNAALMIDWSPLLRDRFAGTPLKRIALHHAGKRVRGEAVLTRHGLEGGAPYAVSGRIGQGPASITLDLRPDESEASLAGRLAGRKPGSSLSTHLRKRLHLPPVAVALLREAGAPPSAPDDLARLVKAVPLEVEGVAGLDRAISTGGGVSFDELDADFMLRRRPGTFLAGEMLDWQAPTGGYLLQACFATGVAAGRGAARFCQAPAD